MRKYYFAWHHVNGEPFPLAWVEEDGLVVGGIPEIIGGTLTEITKEEFEGGLLPLEKEFPLVIPPIVKLTDQE